MKLSGYQSQGSNSPTCTITFESTDQPFRRLKGDITVSVMIFGEFQLFAKINLVIDSRVYCLTFVLL